MDPTTSGFSGTPTPLTKLFVTKNSTLVDVGALDQPPVTTWNCPNTFYIKGNIKDNETKSKALFFRLYCYFEQTFVFYVLCLCRNILFIYFISFWFLPSTGCFPPLTNNFHLRPFCFQPLNDYFRPLILRLGSFLHNSLAALNDFPSGNLIN